MAESKSITVTEERLISAIVTTLMDYFSDADVTGIVLREHQARSLAYAIVLRGMLPFEKPSTKTNENGESPARSSRASGRNRVVHRP